MEQRKLPVYIVLGTRAQFIKVAPLMRMMRDQGLPYVLIYTAQHREDIGEILDLYGLPKPDVALYGWQEANTRSTFVQWFFLVFMKVLFRSRSYVTEPGLLLTHGDTVTTWLAALLGRRSGCVIGHIESGCRSFNIFSPFPEELNRLVTFRLTDIFFCADDAALENVKGYRGDKVKLGANTMLDAVRYALAYPQPRRYDFQASPYAVVSIHRFENIFTARLTNLVVPLLKEIASDYHLIVTLHPTTRKRLLALGLLDELSAQPNVTLHQRFNFVDWISVCRTAEFVITDGGSNQEELSYLGVPTLILRNETERQEGLGETALLSRFDGQAIKDFLERPTKYRRSPTGSDAQPSQRIIEVIRAA